MSTIHFIGGEKGGVGKSVFARILTQYFIDRAIPFIGLDADRSHPTLTRHYEAYTYPIDLDYFESTDQIMEFAIENRTDIMVDLPAQSERFLERWIEANDILSMCEEMDINIVYWYLVDGGKDSVGLLKRFLPKHSVLMTCAVIKNLGCGSDFSEVDSVLSAVSPSARGTLKTATFPALHTPTMDKIDKFNLSFWAAANNTEGPEHLNLMERQRTKVWTQKSYAIFDDILAQV